MNKDMQQKVAELQFLEQQANQINQQANTIQSNIIELKTLNEALFDLENVEKGKDIFIPLGSGFFISASMGENKELLMNVGSKTLVKKSYKEAKDLVAVQSKELEKVLPQLEKQMMGIGIKGQALQQELQEAQKK
ncbi:MAG: prefoldin subunit alpha [Nanoarchaeota archaeon]|nr:prefoldin subunit alpha [Nanoarchaeota archaeon]MBU1445036.1 prefoldin subunit alpha [Nanoarchaeota archaeon]MBU2420046.1 prefoldin subunit alpha [Nanoarchaeota archaeon]MBU2475474.1 prefoldin subunit alpha [Nanoarchaeota archaeon]